MSGVGPRAPLLKGLEITTVLGYDLEEETHGTVAQGLSIEVGYAMNKNEDLEYVFIELYRTSFRVKYWGQCPLLPMSMDV